MLQSVKKSDEKIINLPFPGIICEAILPCELNETHLKNLEIQQNITAI